MKGKPLPKTLDVPDLPLEPFRPGQKYAAHVVEIIPDWEGEIDLDCVHELLEANNYMDLPEPLCPKEKEHGLVYHMHPCIINQDNGKKTIIKYNMCKQLRS